jgi:hypothetical protein
MEAKWLAISQLKLSFFWTKARANTFSKVAGTCSTAEAKESRLQSEAAPGCMSILQTTDVFGRLITWLLTKTA